MRTTDPGVCVRSGPPPPVAAGQKPRIVAVDAAPGLALIGMMAVGVVGQTALCVEAYDGQKRRATGRLVVGDE